jgi:hypothetical protein
MMYSARSLRRSARSSVSSRELLVSYDYIMMFAIEYSPHAEKLENYVSHERLERPQKLAMALRPNRSQRHYHGW